MSNTKRRIFKVIGNWKLDIGHSRPWRAGFTLPEVVVVIGIMLTLLGISTIALTRAQQQTSLNTILNVFVADLKEQQTKAMAGDTEGSGNTADYGLHFESGSYTLFRDVYGTADFVVDLPGTVQVSTSFPSSQIVFLQGSGEVGSAGTITFTNTASNEQKRITINKYGVIEEVESLP